MTIDKETGEILNNSTEGARSFNSFLSALEDGQLHTDLSDELHDLNAEMNNHILDYGNKAKGKITLNIDFLLEKGAFVITSSYKITKPIAPRNMSVAYSTPGNNFTPFNPKQQDMFKDVSSKQIKNIA